MALAVDGMWGSRTISRLQVYLTEHGHSVKADGIFGMKTTSALQTFLSKEGFQPGKVDGMWNWDSIKATQAWTKKQTGQPKSIDGNWGTESIKAIQTLLNAPPASCQAQPSAPEAQAYPVSTETPQPVASPAQPTSEAAKPAAAPAARLRGAGPKPTIAFIGGTGRMGIPLCAAWANAGYDVKMCSRTKDKAQKIVDQLLTGNGYEEKVMQGSVTVPPCDTAHWKLSAGANEDAAAAELIVLGTAYEQAWPLLEAIAPQIRGKGKTILDMTNPFLKRPDGFGAGLPKDGPQSGILIHQQKLNDPSVKWAGAYKTLLWTLILPSGPKNPNRPEIEVFGDAEAVQVVSELITAHGWTPRERGGLEVSPNYEGGKISFGKILGNMKREIFQGEKLSVGW